MLIYERDIQCITSEEYAFHREKYVYSFSFVFLQKHLPMSGVIIANELGNFYMHIKAM
jgi:hypothetical protein